ncbi:hypothetical protein [Rhodococcus sp. ABRD24]|uniref:hypothetical protein n=1 Tax=Rhodococcus sp. ABRD24 TaxID=2507582 RepID=UPI0013F160F7|nr:hypothetical protein [Rhodococcus sp. ABRD24]
MTRRIAGTLAALALTLSLGAVAAPSASAAEPSPVQGSSVGVCLSLPLGSLVWSVCI